MVLSKILTWTPGITLFISLCITTPTGHAIDRDLAIERMGDIGQFIIPATALTMPLLEDDRSRATRFAAQYAATMGLTYALKVSVNETRPNGANYSFPSGHTASAFAGAFSLHEQYGWKTAIPAYIVASFVGWSRVHSNKHWPHDVFAGAALALAVNRFSAYQWPAKNTSLVPAYQQQVIGLQFRHQW